MPESPTRRVEPVVARAEAQPLLWNNPDDPTRELSDEQKGAAEQACAVMRQLAERPWQPRRERGAMPNVDRFLPTIDPERLNHVVLLDGKRGSGKTALLITLLHGWSWGVRGKPKREQYDPDAELQEHLRPLGRIVPVGLVDLQPLPKSTNLLLHLVGQLHRVVEAMEEQVAPAPRAAWQPAGPEELASRRSWRHFLQAAAAGWDGNLDRRGGHLDPEAYAQELEEASRRRLDVVSTFRRFLDDLTEDYRRFMKFPEHEPPFFVIPVDDADMNPQRSVELLDLVRTLWHPRIAFLLTGDSSLFIRALYPTVLDSLLLHGERDFEVREETRQDAQPLIRDIYDKAIPRGHRCGLANLTPDERYRRINVELELGTLNSPLPRAPATLAELLERCPEFREALPDRLRSIADLKQQTAINKNNLNRIAIALWEAALESPELNDEQRSTLSKATKGASGQQLAQTILNQVRPEYARQITTRIPAATGLHAVVNMAPIIQWRCDEKPLPQHHSACTQFIFDALKWHRGTITGSPPRPTTGFIDTIHEEFGSFPWPLPKWPFFEQYISFFRAWTSTARDTFHTTDTNIDRWAIQYVKLIIQHAGLEQVDDNLDTLAAAALRLVSSQEDYYRDWVFKGAPLLAAPEFGLSPDTANTWLESLSRNFHAQNPDAPLDLVLRVSRRDAAAAWLQGHSADNEDSLLAQLDERYPEHRWSRIVEGRSTEHVTGVKPINLFDWVRDSTMNVRVKYRTLVSPNFNTSAAALSSYLTSSRLDDLMTLPQQTLISMISTIARFRTFNDPAQQALVAMWGTAASKTSVPWATALSYATGHATFATDIHEWSGRPTIDTMDGLQIPADMSSGMVLVLSKAQLTWRPTGSRFDDESMGPAYRALLKMTWDVVCDETQFVPSEQLLLAPWWLAAGLQRDTSIPRAYPWPAVRWPSFLDWEMLMDSWNNGPHAALSGIAREDIPESLRVQQADIDAVAYWYMESIRLISSRHEPPYQRNLSRDLLPEHWNRLLEDFVPRKPVGEKFSLSWNAFVDDCDRLALLAAPESGLQPTTATCILQGFGLDPKKRELLKEFRRERLRFLGVLADTEIEAELKAIDALFPEHPWVTEIEQGSKSTE